MINNFLIKAFPEKNQLHIILDGIFMNSEIDLAKHLVRKECKKLMRGFITLIDINNMDTPQRGQTLTINKINKMMKILGCGELRYIGLKPLFEEVMENNGGLYAYENEWLF